MSAAMDELLPGLRRGDAAAFRALDRALRPRLRRLLQRHHGDPELVEDALQVTLLQVFLRISSFDGRAGLSTWVTRIALNAAFMQARTQRRYERRIEALRDSAAEPAAAPSPEEAALLGERVRCLAEAMERLPADQRLAYQLAQAGGLGLHEIAGKVGAPRPTVASRISRARKALRAQVLA